MALVPLMMLEPDSLIISLVGILILGLLLASPTLWIWVGLRLVHRLPVWSRRFRSDRLPVPWPASLLVLLYLALTFWSLLRHAPQFEFEVQRTLLLVQNSIVEATMITGTVLITLLLFTKQKTDLMRLGFRPDDLAGQCRDGGLGFVASLLPVFLVLLLTFPLRSDETTHPFLRLLAESDLTESLPPVLLAAVVLAPLKEELIFRVVLQSWLVNKLGVQAGILVGAIIFAGAHGFPDSLGLIPLALLLGIVYHVRRSVLAVILMHALFNAFNITLMLLQLWTGWEI